MIDQCSLIWLHQSINSSNHWLAIWTSMTLSNNNYTILVSISVIKSCINFFIFGIADTFCTVCQSLVIGTSEDFPYFCLKFLRSTHDPRPQAAESSTQWLQSIKIRFLAALFVIHTMIALKLLLLFFLPLVHCQ